MTLIDELEFLKPFPHPEHLLHITERLIDRFKPERMTVARFCDSKCKSTRRGFLGGDLAF